MRVYIIGSSKEIPRVRAAEQTLSAAGCTIVSEWIAPVERHGTAGVALPDYARARYAMANLAAIDRADIVLVLWPQTESIGAYFEAGYAFSRATTSSFSDPFGVVWAGGPADGTIWHSLARQVPTCRTYDTDEEAIGWIVTFREMLNQGTETMAKRPQEEEVVETHCFGCGAVLDVHPVCQSCPPGTPIQVVERMS